MVLDREHGRIQDFKLGRGALKKIAPSGGKRVNFWGISCEKSRFYAKKIIFFPILGGGRAGAPPPWIRLWRGVVKELESVSQYYGSGLPNKGIKRLAQCES